MTQPNSPAGFEIQRTVEASADSVFSAFTDAATFSRWFGGPEVEVASDRTNLDPRPGGGWHAEMRLPNGNTVDWDGTYQEVVRPARLVFTIRDQPDSLFETITVSLRTTEEGTELTLTQTGGNLDVETYHHARGGWVMFLNTLALLLDGSESGDR